MPARWPAVAISPFTETEEDIGAIAADVTALRADVATVQAEASSHVKKTGDTMTGRLLVPDGNASSPSPAFRNNSNTGSFRVALNQWGISVGGVERFKVAVNQWLAKADGTASLPVFSWTDDTDTGMYRASDNNLQFATGGTARFGITTAEFQAPIIGDNTTGSVANVFVSSTGSRVVERSTSARKYKSHISKADYLADIDLQPVKFWRDDDQRWWYGFIADDLGDQDSLFGEYGEDGIENFDSRAVMAAMAAKINKLEERLSVLEVDADAT